MKVNWYAIGFFSVVAAVLFFWGWRCGNAEKVAPSKGVAIHDTIPGKIEVVIDTHYVPKPHKVVEYKYKTHDNSHDTIYLIDTVEVINDCLASRYYSDTVKIDFGKVVIDDTVSENRITGRKVKTFQTHHIIKETILLESVKRSILYLGFSGTGSKQNFFYSIGTDISLKTRNDKIYSAGVSLTNDNQVLFGAGFKLPIKLRR